MSNSLSRSGNKDFIVGSGSGKWRIEGGDTVARILCVRRVQAFSLRTDKHEPVRNPIAQKLLSVASVLAMVVAVIRTG
jgi:hypothetical protein